MKIRTFRTVEMSIVSDGVSDKLDNETTWTAARLYHTMAGGVVTKDSNIEVETEYPVQNMFWYTSRVRYVSDATEKAR